MNLVTDSNGIFFAPVLPVGTYPPPAEPAAKVQTLVGSARWRVRYRWFSELAVHSLAAAKWSNPNTVVARAQGSLASVRTRVKA